MRKRLMWVFFGVVLISILAFKAPVERYFDIAKSLDIFATLFKEVNAYYVDEVVPEELIHKGIDGMLNSLDPYTTYIPEDESESFSISTTGIYGGIGAMISVVNGSTVITDPYESFPAHRAGLKVGDEIVKIDQKDVQGMPLSEVSKLLKGHPKTSLELTIKRPGISKEISFSLTRERIKINNVSYSGLLENQIGYIRLDDFTIGAGTDVERSVKELKEQGAKEIVLDLRNNPGGLLHEAINVVNVFIPKGEVVVSTKGKVKDWNKIYRTLNDPVDTEIPVVVLISGNSASASEIVAGSLQDYDRAVLVGQKTFGKGLVQTTRLLSYNTRLKVTTAKYYIPSGRCIQELDYAHREEDGSVRKYADSLRARFETTNGRIVYDGRGLNPDIGVENEYLGQVTTALLNQGLLFEYATLYCNRNVDPKIYKDFQISEQEYQHFVKWIQDRHFEYTSSIDKEVKDLVASAKKETYYQDLEAPLNSMKEKIVKDKVDDFVRFKDEIKTVLSKEICFHYGLHKGVADYSLQKDDVIKEALKIHHVEGRYEEILSPN